jgi:hypothetical protein
MSIIPFIKRKWGAEKSNIACNTYLEIKGQSSHLSKFFFSFSDIRIHSIINISCKHGRPYCALPVFT